MHAGVIQDERGGFVDVMPVEKKKSYVGSLKNGVQSERWDFFLCTFLLFSTLRSFVCQSQQISATKAGGLEIRDLTVSLWILRPKQIERVVLLLPFTSEELLLDWCETLLSLVIFYYSTSPYIFVVSFGPTLLVSVKNCKSVLPKSCTSRWLQWSSQHSFSPF